METASSVCDLSDFQTIGASEIITSVSFPASAASCSSSHVSSASCRSESRGRSRARNVKCGVTKNKDRSYMLDTGGRNLSREQIHRITHIFGGGHHTKGVQKSKKEEIETFIAAYQYPHNYNDVPVATMRHIIPILLMEIYPQEYGQFSRKVKGMWERKPADWPANVAFVDPNNKIKVRGDRGSKPTKEVLVPMLAYLVRKYKTDRENATCQLTYHRRSDHLLSSESVVRDDDDGSGFQLRESWSNEGGYGSGCGDWDLRTDNDLFGPKSGEFGFTETTTTTQYHSGSSSYGRLRHEAAEAVAWIPQVPSNRSDSSSYAISGLYDSMQSQQVSDTSDIVEMSAGGYVSCHGSVPHQVQDDGAWDPVNDVIGRIESKTGFLAKSKAVPEPDLSLLLKTKEILVQNFTEMKECKEQLIEKAHIVESLVDIIKLNGNFSVQWKQKLDDIQGTIVKEQHMEEDSAAGDIQLSSITESVVGTPVLQPVPGILVNQLNIETRAEVGDSLLATADVLHVRPDVDVSLEHREMIGGGRTGAGIYSEHLRPALQETTGATVGEWTTQELREKTDKALEIDFLNDLLNYDYDPMLHVLDSGMVQHELDSCLPQVLPVEDMIEGPAPSATAPSTRAGPGELNCQLPQRAFGMQSTLVSYGENVMANFSSGGNPRSSWEQLSVEGDLSQSGSRNGGHKVSYFSLPIIPPYCSPTQLPALQLGPVGTVPVTVTVTSHQQSCFNSSNSSVTKFPVSVRVGMPSKAVTTSSGINPLSVANIGLVSASNRVDMPTKAITVSSSSNPLSAANTGAGAKPLTPLSAVNVCSPVGQITGTMDHLSIDSNVSYPLLRGMLTEPVASQAGGKDQKCSADQQKSGEDSMPSAASKRMAPIPVMVEEVDYDDGSFAGPSVKKVRPSAADRR